MTVRRQDWCWQVGLTLSRCCFWAGVSGMEGRGFPRGHGQKPFPLGSAWGPAADSQWLGGQRAEGRAQHLSSPPPPPLVTALFPYTSVTLDIWVPPRSTKMTDQCHGLCLAEVGFWLAGDHAGRRPERWAVQSHGSDRGLSGTGTLLAAWPWGVRVLAGGWETGRGSA